MASWQAYIAVWMLKRRFKPRLAHAGGNVSRMRKLMTPPPFRVPRGVTIMPASVGGIAGEWVEPTGGGGHTLLYLHGGGYFACSAETHRPITAGFARLEAGVDRARVDRVRVDRAGKLAAADRGRGRFRRRRTRARAAGGEPGQGRSLARGRGAVLTLDGSGRHRRFDPLERPALRHVRRRANRARSAPLPGRRRPSKPAGLAALCGSVRFPSLADPCGEGRSAVGRFPKVGRACPRGRCRG